ncbi:hypothetical protein ACSU64_27905 [Bacillaceae bacterium C204]|uniref:hypothetical protein n=1 Tax=Neobacillus sp. 204 TaxID=3383351 RepID=UPI00397CCCFB
MKLINVTKGKVHISKNGKDQSLCGQAPWSNPVTFFSGEFEEVTCKRCKKAKVQLGGNLER